MLTARDERWYHHRSDTDSLGGTNPKQRNSIEPQATVRDDDACLGSDFCNILRLGALYIPITK